MNQVIIVSLAILVLAPASAGSVEIFACEPEWEALVAEIAAEDAEVTVATAASNSIFPHARARSMLCVWSARSCRTTRG